MADAMDLRTAKETFDTLCEMLDEKELRYEKDDENLAVNLTMHGDDLPVAMHFVVDTERNFVITLSPLPFRVKEDKMLDMAIAVSALNYRMVNGSFDYDLAKGKLTFRMTTSYRESRLGKEALFYMLACTVTTVDEYNDKLMMLAKGMISLEKFMESIG